MLNILRMLLKDEEGQGLVEYGLIIGLVAIFLIAALVYLAGGPDVVFDTITEELDDVTETDVPSKD